MSNLLVITNLTYASARQLSPVYCINPTKTIDNIINISDKFDQCFIINDNHLINDTEFKYVPQHAIMDTQDSMGLIYYYNLILVKKLLVLNKNKFSIISNNHNKELILNKFDSICLTGFSASLDIIPSILDLISNDQNILIYKDGISDLSEESLKRSIDYLTWLGIKQL